MSHTAQIWILMANFGCIPGMLGSNSYFLFHCTIPFFNQASFLSLCSETVTAQRNEEMNFLQVELGARTRRSSFACDVLPLSYLAPLFAQYYQSQSVALMTVAFHQQTACLGNSLLLMQIFKVLQTGHKMVRKSLLHPT